MGSLMIWQSAHRIRFFRAGPRSTGAGRSRTIPPTRIEQSQLDDLLQSGWTGTAGGCPRSAIGRWPGGGLPAGARAVSPTGFQRNPAPGTTGACAALVLPDDQNWIFVNQKNSDHRAKAAGGGCFAGAPYAQNSKPGAPVFLKFFFGINDRILGPRGPAIRPPRRLAAGLKTLSREERRGRARPPPRPIGPIC